MAVPYERIVAEDLNQGHGSVSVSMPAGGSAMGNKIGLHTFTGTIFNATDFGAVCDGVTDDSDAIIAAVAAAHGAGGVVQIPGQSLLTKTIEITKDNVLLSGVGASSWGGNTVPTPATSLKWGGVPGGTMIRFTATQGADISHLRRVGLRGLNIDGASLAAVCVDLVSVQFGIFQDLNIMNATTYGVSLRCIGGGAAADGKDTQNCDFSNIAIRCKDSDGECLHLAGDGVSGVLGNASYNVFRNLLLYGNNHPEIHIVNGDNNTFYDVRCFHFGTGKSVVLEMTEGSGGTAGFTVSNTFYHLTPGDFDAGASLFRGGFQQTNGATQNALYEYDRSQGATAPVVTSGVLLWTESVLNGAEWNLPIPLLVLGGELRVTQGGGASGVRVQNTEPTSAGGVDLYDEMGVFAANLTCRGSSNSLLPGRIALITGDHEIHLGTQFDTKIHIPIAGGLVVGAGLPTTATDGFLYIATVPGPPTETPTPRTGCVPMVWETPAAKLWIYDGGWKSVTFT